jgi:hypothetical protein
MAKILYFNFDGTSNQPEDAIQKLSAVKSTIENENISNVLKFHLLLGGQLKTVNDHETTIHTNGSKSFYYQGVGTYGSFPARLINSALAPEKCDVANILNMAKESFKANFNESVDYIVLTGFSRGAALARRFASIINDEVGRKIIIEAVCDTVASIGKPNLSKTDRPKNAVVFEKGHTLPSNVIKALHCVSLDEKRNVFQPTLMNQDGRVLELWFAGAHSDVGGGYWYDGLSDLVLRFMLDWFEEQSELAIEFKTPYTINYEDLTPNPKINISFDDMQIDPSAFAPSHEQERMSFIEDITLSDRLLCRIKEERIISATEQDCPLVHWSVAERIFNPRVDYKPASLQGLHRILYDDGMTEVFSHRSAHKLKSQRRQLILSDECPSYTVKVLAHRKFNNTTVWLEEGKQYTIYVDLADNLRWNDAGIHSLDGEGWKRDTSSLSNFFKNLFIKQKESARRIADADWFALCACFDNTDDEHSFKIGNRIGPYKATKTGELYLFANDLDGYYGNNSGALKVIIEQH